MASAAAAVAEAGAAASGGGAVKISKAVAPSPPAFKCPITHEVMEDPVCTCDGHTFERSAIESWLVSRDTSPLTGLKLESRTLLSNVALRCAIEEYFQGFAKQDAQHIDFGEIELTGEISVAKAKAVYEGQWRGKDVAVLKVAKGSCDMEVSALARLSKHASLVRFYGLATDGSGHDYLLTELAPRGSLRTTIEQIEEVGHDICFGTMMAISHQVCEGMEAVAAEGLLHRNLGLRNILCFQLDPTDPSLTDVKVGDFGLSKSGQAYVGREEGCAVAWLSPEALTKRTWSEKSDVWAFGVTLWELFSEGTVPFADMESDEAITKAVVTGDRLGRPVLCPSDVYKVLQFCWQRRPEDRPAFRSLRILLRDAERDVAVAEALAERTSRRRDSTVSRGGGGDGATTPMRSDSGNSSKGTTTSDKNTPEDAQSKIELVIGRMTQSVADARIQEEGARALANLAGTAFGRTHIAKMHGIEALVAAMRAHTAVKAMQECAVAALSNLSASHAENQVKIAEKGGIEVLISAMREHRQKPLVQQYGATALRNLTLHNAENKKAIARMKGIDALISAMETHPKHAAVQQYAADAIQNIALHNADNKIAIQKRGGITVLIKAMQQHRSESRVQQYICFALANLSANNAFNAELIAKEGAIEEIIVAMTSHRGKPGVQRYGASALKYLAGENKDNQEKIAEHGGIKALVQAMTTHRTNDAVQQYAASALKNLAANNSENKSHIATDGGIAVLLTAMRSHRMKPLVQQHAASALQNLAGNHTHNKERIATDGGIPLIIAAMSNHPRESQVQRYAASALKNLSSDNSENKLTIARSGGIEALVAAVVNHGSESEVQQYAAGALQNIAANNAFTKAEVVRLGGVSALNESLRTSSSVRRNNTVRESLESALKVIDN
mmetsp:Transcript_7081/g.18164  ORF Transcript_7081/g.18164 Transcript_7081/m.18164 type:complete len:901 (-) Transcript_7081:3417-6119(-)